MNPLQVARLELSLERLRALGGLGAWCPVPRARGGFVAKKKPIHLLP
jgi:hypothetical protein